MKNLWSLINSCFLIKTNSTNPLDMAKLRIQVQRRHVNSGTATDTVGFNYNNVFDGIVKIFREEGIRGMFKGATARMAFQV